MLFGSMSTLGGRGRLFIFAPKPARECFGRNKLQIVMFGGVGDDDDGESQLFGSPNLV